MNNVITWLYVAFSFVTIAAYIPTIMKMLKESESDSSIPGWIIWFTSSILGVLYAGIVLEAMPLLFLNLGHLFGTGTILTIQISKRKKTLLG